jgi:hypothetical protein
MAKETHGRRYYWKHCDVKIAVTLQNVENKKCPICGMIIPEEEQKRASAYLVMRKL